LSAPAAIVVIRKMKSAVRDIVQGFMPESPS